MRKEGNREGEGRAKKKAFFIDEQRKLYLLLHSENILQHILQ
jgi:hypothetical protein